MIIQADQYGGVCSCGQKHQMETQLAVIEAGCLSRASEYLEQWNLTGFCTAIYDENTYRAKGIVHPKADAEIILNPENLHANEKAVAQVLEKLDSRTQVLLAIGAGTIHDVTRYCAYQKGIPFVSCPTAASVDGFCSGVAAMTWEGAKKTLPAVSPVLVLADMNVICQAPLYLALSGVGDMIGKFIALTDWKIANILNGEYYCDRIAGITRQATQDVMDCALELAAGKMEAYEKLIYGLLMSGLAMQMLGNSRPASGAEHHISHIIEMEPDALHIHSDALHGEKVGVGTLLAAREYHRMAEHTHWKDYEDYSQEEIYAVFGDRLCRQIQKENTPDVAAGITGERICQCLPQLREQIAGIPTAEALEKLYRTLGLKTTLADIGVTEELAPTLLDTCPMVRQRLTWMRLRRCMA